MPGIDRNLRNSIGLLGLMSLAGTLKPSEVWAGSLSVSPPFQYLMVSTNASESAALTKLKTGGIIPGSIARGFVEYSNQSDKAINLQFSLAHIQATDMLGRLQFNAPLPQTILPANNELAAIEPSLLTIGPDQVATVSVTFNPNKIEPGKTAYLLLGELVDHNPTKTGKTNVSQYVGSTMIIRDPTSMHPKLEFRELNNPTFPIQLNLPDFFRLSVKNSGTAATIPRGIMRITDQFNREVMRGPINEQSATVLPGSERIIYSRLKRSETAFPVSICTLHLSVYDDEKVGVTNKTYRFLYISPWLIAGLLGLLTIGFIVRKKLRRV